MNTQPPFDIRLGDYLGEGPTNLPIEDRERIARAAAGFSQRRRWQDRLGSGGQRLLGAVAGSVVTLAAVVAVMSSPALFIDRGGPGASPSASTVAPSFGPGTNVQLMPTGVELAPGRYAIQSTVRTELTIGAGWYATDNGASIMRRFADSADPGIAVAVSISVFWPYYIVTDVCGQGPAMPIGASGGLTVADVAAAIEGQVGVVRVGPVPAQIGNLPAQKYELGLPASCGPPEGREVIGSVALFTGATLTLYLVDVGGEPRVIAVTEQHGQPPRRATDDQLAMVDAVLASMYLWDDSP